MSPCPSAALPIAPSSAARSWSATTVRIERPSAGSASPLLTPCCSRTTGALARAIEHERARGAGRAVCRERDLVVEPDRYGASAPRLEIEIVHVDLHIAGL